MQPPRTTGWLDPTVFPFTATMQEHASEIAREAASLLDQSLWTVWQEGEYRPTGELTRVGQGDEPCWRLFGLYLRGKPILANCARCPNTARVLADIPDVTKAGFSVLEPGYVMEPHLGHDPKNFRVHLGLIVPEGDCGLKVSGESRGWQVGQVTMFDDTFVHEAWNRTAEPRVVLIVDVLNPAFRGR